MRCVLTFSGGHRYRYGCTCLCSLSLACCLYISFFILLVIQAVGSAGRGLYVEVLARCVLPSEM